MLPHAHRMRDGEEFRRAIRRGTKGVQPDIVVHLGRAQTPTDPTSVGFVVSKQVGNAVVRNRVKRKLRHQVASRLHDVPAGSLIVARALPGSAHQTSTELGQQFDAALRQIQKRLNQ